MKNPRPKPVFVPVADVPPAPESQSTVQPAAQPAAEAPAAPTPADNVAPPAPVVPTAETTQAAVLVLPAAGQPADLGYLSALAKSMAPPKDGKPLRQRATIDLDSELYDRINIIAALNKSTMREDVEKILMRAYFPERFAGKT